MGHFGFSFRKMKKWIKKNIELILAVLFLLFLLSLFSGCQNPLVKPARAFVDTVGSEYLEYVENDATLGEGAKRARRANVEAFLMLINEAEK